MAQPLTKHRHSESAAARTSSPELAAAPPCSGPETICDIVSKSGSDASAAGVPSLDKAPPSSVSARPFKEPIGPRVHRAITAWVRGAERRLRITDRYRFEDRRRSSSLLHCVLAGPSPHARVHDLPSIAAAMENRYACLVSAGTYDERFSAIAAHLGWSYLATQTDDEALAQNICYRLHPEARTIVKIDHDMLVLPGSLTALVKRFNELHRDPTIAAAAVAAFVPLDGLCLRPLLCALGLLDDFEARFGPLMQASAGSSIETDPSIARWVWRHTGPLSNTAAKLAELPEILVMATVRLRAGLVVFPREHWESIGYFPVHRSRLSVGQRSYGADGDALSVGAMISGRPIVLTSRAVAGRLAFPAQKAAISDLITRSPQLFSSGPGDCS